MDPHPLANLFKRSNHDVSIASELSALDFLYKVLLEIREFENSDEEIYEVIHDSSLNEKHDCNDFTINSINVNCANNMQNPKLGDASFAMSTTYCNDLGFITEGNTYRRCAASSLPLWVNTDVVQAGIRMH